MNTLMALQDRMIQNVTVRCTVQGTPVDGTGEPGNVLQFDGDAIVVACGEGALRLDELQLPGKRRAPTHEFAGQTDLSGRQLG